MGIIPCGLIHLSGAETNGGNLAQLGGRMGNDGGKDGQSGRRGGADQKEA